ncbi:hypothetical protein ABG79_01475 [Caloramator mitchellensis]|uniref:NfeD-like C-terminal domain-containing protein n=1 Tax=Caloramator mitchellensis TaxID=908809 RepID=A0A0R3JT75_CALMK|nr:NfeD family protein [Caloramator mitchellensis]KRQ86723.1 hypothetical protein ABG79_01475 [Caloramator mitchellensis]
MGLLFLWIAVAIAGIIADIVTSGYVFFVFTVGSIFAIISGMFGAAYAVQIIVFLIVSAATFGVSYPIIKRTIKQTVNKTLRMEEEYIGRELVADEDIADKALVKIEGIYWTVKNLNGVIKKGDKIKIVGIEGNKILVEKVEGGI